MVENVRIAYTRFDGGLSVITIDPSFPGTVDDFINGYERQVGEDVVEVTPKKRLRKAVTKTIIITEFVPGHVIHAGNDEGGQPIIAPLADTKYAVLTVDDLPLLGDETAKQQRRRPYRNAWQLVDGKLSHDMSAAKEIHLKNIRAVRAGRLDELDKQYTIASRDKTGTAALDKQRAELLSVTDSIKAATPATAEKLYSMWPTILEKRK